VIGYHTTADNGSMDAGSAGQMRHFLDASLQLPMTHHYLMNPLRHNEAYTEVRVYR